MFCLLCACTRDDPKPAATASGDSHDSSLCGSAYPEYAPGMTVEVKGIKARLVDAQPSPPRQKVPNHWQVEVVDAQGAPMPDVSLQNPDSYMPVHNHHGRTRPAIAQASIRDIDFNMRGPWQVLVDLQRGDAKLGTATFQVCVH